jgi:hypothetical protein
LTAFNKCGKLAQDQRIEPLLTQNFVVQTHLGICARMRSKIGRQRCQAAEDLILIQFSALSKRETRPQTFVAG